MGRTEEYSFIVPREKRSMPNGIELKNPDSKFSPDATKSNAIEFATSELYPDLDAAVEAYEALSARFSGKRRVEISPSLEGNGYRLVFSQQI